MIDAPTTTTLLLDGLRDGANEAAWREFDGRYRPIIEAFARKLGLDDADAADAAQESLLRFLKAYRDGKYDRSQGRLRSWIIGIVKYRVADIRASRVRRQAARGESVLVNLPADEQLDQLWEEECRQAMLRAALTELRQHTRTTDQTIAAFERVVLQQRPAAEVADELGMTVHSVYVAKHHVTDRLREIVARLHPAYAD